MGWLRWDEALSALGSVNPWLLPSVLPPASVLSSNLRVKTLGLRSGLILAAASRIAMGCALNPALLHRCPLSQRDPSDSALSPAPQPPSARSSKPLHLRSPGLDQVPSKPPLPSPASRTRLDPTILPHWCHWCHSLHYCPSPGEGNSVSLISHFLPRLCQGLSMPRACVGCVGGWLPWGPPW